jgi:hypothetical protein
MVVGMRIHLLLITAAAHLTLQTPLNFVENRPEISTHPSIVSPVSILDSKTINSADNHELDNSELATTTNTNSQLPDPVLKARTPTLYIKTNASDCNVQGGLGAWAPDSAFFVQPTVLNSVLDCQSLCQQTSNCESYSWQMTNENAVSCKMYFMRIYQNPGTVSYGATGVWFSDKNVMDGTMWCYSSTPFMGSVLPGGPIIIT